jgi:hypothetical protein
LFVVECGLSIPRSPNRRFDDYFDVVRQLREVLRKLERRLNDDEDKHEMSSCESRTNVGVLSKERGIDFVHHPKTGARDRMMVTVRFIGA